MGSSATAIVTGIVAAQALADVSAGDAGDAVDLTFANSLASRLEGHPDNVAPALYPLDNNGYIASNGLSVPIGQERLATRGARACPERVIEVRDTSDEHR